MVKIKKQFNELFDNPYPYKQVSRNHDRKTYQFFTDSDRSFRVIITDDSQEAAGTILDEAIKRGWLPSDLPRMLMRRNIATYVLSQSVHFEDSDGRTDITGEGDQYRIFATIESVLANEVFDAKETPDVFSIISEASESSRVRLYQTFAKRIMRKTSYVEFVVSEEELYSLDGLSDGKTIWRILASPELKKRIELIGRYPFNAHAVITRVSSLLNLRYEDRVLSKAKIIDYAKNKNIGVDERPIRPRGVPVPRQAPIRFFSREEYEALSAHVAANLENFKGV